MDATGFKAKGSFGVPPEMKKDLEEQRRRAEMPKEAPQDRKSVV